MPQLTPSDISLELDNIKSKLKKYLNITLGSKIGSGLFGSAFMISSNKVLKISTDKVEAENNAKMQKLNLKHYVKVYRVFQFKSLPNFYFSILEFLQPVSDLVGNLLEFFRKPLNIFYKKIMDKKGPLNDITITEGPRKNERQDILAKFQQNQFQFSPEALALVRYGLTDSIFTQVAHYFRALDTLNDAVRYPEKLNQVVDAFEEFRIHGFNKLDSHRDNAGMKKGVLKFFDFGNVSQIPGSGKIETIEGQLKMKPIRIKYRRRILDNIAIIKERLAK